MMRLTDVPNSVRHTFSDYFDHFKREPLFEFSATMFFRTINVDELVAKYGEERVEQDYLSLCKLDFRLRQLLRQDGLQP
jgi:hypothetical protein